MLKHLRSSLVAVSMAVNAYAAPVLHIHAGQLVGATNVAVSGVNYSVQFQDGTCALLFNDCDAYADFPFQTGDGALAASQALLTGVLVDTAQGLFGSNPALTNGCSDAQLCQVFTPYPPTPEGFRSFAIALNYDALSQLSDATQVLVTNRPFGDTTGIAGYTYAVWSLAPASEVPEPSTVWMVGAALVLLAYRPRQSAEKSYGLDPGQPGAPFSGDPAPWRVLKWPEAEHGPADHAVCVVQFVDGARQATDCVGMCRPANWYRACKRVDMNLDTPRRVVVALLSRARYTPVELANRAFLQNQSVEIVYIFSCNTLQASFDA